MRYIGVPSPSQLTPTLTPKQAKHAVAVHWGTFPLTSEPLLEPPKRLRAAAAAAVTLTLNSNPNPDPKPNSNPNPNPNPNPDPNSNPNPDSNPI